MADKALDVVLFGATGFTGGLTAEYLAAHAPEGMHWALAGRNMEKLEAVKQRLGAAGASVQLLRAEVKDADSIRVIAESARVVITTVGPYIEYGEPLVAACAAAGTDYVDLTGEPEFVDRMWLKYHEQAQRTGARIVHSCGFDSIPYDLGTLFTVEQMPEGVPLHVDCFVRMAGSFSGGTYHSALKIFGRLRQGARTARERHRREDRPSGRRVRGAAGRPRRDARANAWIAPMPTIDPQTVLRSARALDRYGPDFSYGHYLAVKRLPVLAGLTLGAGAVIVLAQIPPARNLMLNLKHSGEGPSPEERAKSWFKVRFSASTPGGKHILTEVSGGDPGYTETSKMLAESALCLAFDELPENAGQLTPAVAMGDALIARLKRAGIVFRVLEEVSA